VLVLVLVGVPAKELPAVAGVSSGIGDRVEFVVAHDDVSTAAVDHAFDDLQDAQLIGASIDQVPDEDRLAFGMLVDTGQIVAAIVETAQQFFERGGAAMNVADDVVTGELG
jgi:hypothetical protein